MRKITFLLLGICLGACAALFFSRPPVRSAGTESSATPPVSIAMQDKALSKAPKAAAVAMPWSFIESTNYEVYVANLRKVGCPEGTITDIINADVRQSLGPLPTTRGIPSLAPLIAREKQVRETLKALGVAPGLEPGDTIISGEQRVKFREAINQFNPAPSDSAAERERAAKRRNLIGPLTPEQEIYFKSEFEHYGDTVVTVLSGFLPTQQEYYAMIAAMDVNTPEELRQKLKTVLTPERYKQYSDMLTPEHVQVFQFCQDVPGIQDKVPELEKVLSNQKNLTLQEYRNQVRAVLDRGAFDRFMFSFPHPSSKK